MSRSRRRTILIIFTTGIAVLGIYILGSSGKMRPVEDFATDLLSPVQYALSRFVQSVQDFGGRLKGFRALQRENEELIQQIEALRTQVDLMREAQIENLTLRAQLGFVDSNADFDVLPAEIIGRDPSNFRQSLTIDRGWNDGVTQGMPVVTARGLVGRVHEVHKSSAQVVLLTDISSSVNVLVQRTRSTGVVQGMIGSNPVVRYLPSDQPVEIGDVVLTSGLGGNFPKRLVVGYVTSVSAQDIDMYQEVEILPAVDFGGLESVLVLLNFSSSAVSGSD